MNKISIDQIKKLREETGAGVMEVKRVLEEASGDAQKAKEALRKYGLIKADKKAGRATRAGIVETYIHATKTCGATVVLTCETDFVARTEEFQNLAHELAMQTCAMNPKDERELLRQPWIKDDKMTIENLIKSYIAKFGENIKVEDFKRFEIKKV